MLQWERLHGGSKKSFRKSVARISMKKTGAPVSDIRDRICVQTQSFTVQQNTPMPAVEDPFTGDRKGYFYCRSHLQRIKLDSVFSIALVSLLWRKREPRQPAQITEISLKTPTVKCGEFLLSISEAVLVFQRDFK